jgi:hypothetical protein
MIVAALTGPTPKTWVRVVPEARTAAASFFFVRVSWASMPRRSARNSDASSRRADATGSAGVIWSRTEAARPAVYLLADPSGDQVAQHGVQAAGDLVTGAGQVPVPTGPDPQHRRVVLGRDLTAGPRAERGDRDRPGVVRVVLAGVPGLQQPDPRGQLRLHVQHPLPGGQQLLGQQTAQPARALDRPGPVRPFRCPSEQLGGLPFRRLYPELSQRFLSRADRHRRMRGLMRVDANHHSHHERNLV